MRSSKMVLAAILVIFFGTGCMSMQVKAPKDPIKVDVTMRLDVYQHVVSDINSVESIVSGNAAAKPKDGMKLNFLFNNAYAEDELTPACKEAAERRRGRLEELSSWEGKGLIGENGSGMVEAKGAGVPADLISAENADRMIIYNSISHKNGVPLEDVQKIYAKKLQDKAPAGTPIEVMNASGSYEWKNK